MIRILTGGTVLALALTWSAWATAQTRDEQPPQDRQDQQQQDQQRRDQDQAQGREHHARGRITAIGASAQVGQSGQTADARRGTFITIEGRKGGRHGGEGRPDAERGDQARRDDRPQDHPDAAPGARADGDDAARRDRGPRTTFLLLVTDATRIELAGAGQQPDQAAANPALNAAQQPGQAAPQDLRGLEVGQRVEVAFQHLEGEHPRDAGQDRNDRDQADPGRSDRDRDQDGREHTVRGVAISVRVLPARVGDDRSDDDQDRPGIRLPGQNP